MVRHVNDRLVCAVHECSLVLHAQHSGALVVLAGSVDNRRVNSTREPLIAIRRVDAELDALAALLELAKPRRGLVPGADGLGAIPDLLAPSLLAAMQVVGPVVGLQLVGLTVEGVYRGGRDAVGDAADGGAKVWAVVRLVVLLRGEALHDVDAADVQGLEDRAEGEEGDLVGRHVCSCSEHCVSSVWCLCWTWLGKRDGCDEEGQAACQLELSYLGILIAIKASVAREAQSIVIGAQRAVVENHPLAIEAPEFRLLCSWLVRLSDFMLDGLGPRMLVVRACSISSAADELP